MTFLHEMWYKCLLIIQVVHMWYKYTINKRITKQRKNKFEEKKNRYNTTDYNGFICRCYLFVYGWLLADAEILEYILQNHIIRHFSSYIVKEEDTLTDILRKKITGDVHIQSLLNSLNSFTRMS